MPLNLTQTPAKNYIPIPSKRSSCHYDAADRNMIATQVSMPPAVRHSSFPLNGDGLYEFALYEPLRQEGENASKSRGMEAVHVMDRNSDYTPILKCPTPSLMYVEQLASMASHPVKLTDTTQDEMGGSAIYNALTPELLIYHGPVEARAATSAMAFSNRQQHQPSPALSPSPYDMEWHDESPRYQPSALAVSPPTTPTSISSPLEMHSPARQTPLTTLSAFSFNGSKSAATTTTAMATIAALSSPHADGDSGLIYQALGRPHPYPHGGVMVPPALAMLSASPTSPFSPLSPFSSSTLPFSASSDAYASEKIRKKKENHNAIERRRRDNINDCIHELCSLVPALASVPQNRLSKSQILKKTGDYIKALRGALKRQTQLMDQATLNLLHNDKQLADFIHEAISYEMDFSSSKDEEDRDSSLGYDQSTDEGRVDTHDEELCFNLLSHAEACPIQLALDMNDRRSVSPTMSIASAPETNGTRDAKRVQSRTLLSKRI